MVKGPAFTVGIVAGTESGQLERTVGAVSEQLEDCDSLLHQQLSDSVAAARNSIIRRSEGDVVVFLDDGGLPLEGWLESIRAAFIDPGVDAVAGAFDPPAGKREPGARPGGRLRWTGHISADYSAKVQAPSSLASGRNCAVRLTTMLRLGGFDESFQADRPYEDVEFFTRLAKAGGRTIFVPEARIFLFGESEPPGLQDQMLFSLEVQARRSRSMAVIFARHEAWALVLMVFSHLLQAIVDVFASRLPNGAPGRILQELASGVKVGARPAAHHFSEGKVRVKGR